MTSRPRARWFLERLCFLLLCIGIGAVYELGKFSWPAHPTPALLAPETTGTCLDRRVGHLNVAKMPLEEVVATLSRQTGQKIDVDWGVFDGDSGVCRQTEVTVDLDDVTLDSALQTIFGKVAAPQARVHYGVMQGIVTVSAWEPRWDVVVRVYDVSDLLERFSAQPGPPRLSSPLSFPLSLPASGGGGGVFSPIPVYTTGRLGSPVLTPAPRDIAMGDLTELAYRFLRADEVPGATSARVTQWADRLIVVATEPQQRDLDRFMVVLRAKLAAREETISTGGR